MKWFKKIISSPENNKKINYSFYNHFLEIKDSILDSRYYLDFYHKFLIYYEELSNHQRITIQNFIIIQSSKLIFESSEEKNCFWHNTFNFFKLMQFEHNELLSNEKKSFLEFFKEFIKTNNYLLQDNASAIEFTKLISDLVCCGDQAAFAQEISQIAIDIPCKNKSYWLLRFEYPQMIIENSLEFFLFCITNKEITLEYNKDVNYFKRLNKLLSYKDENYIISSISKIESIIMEISKYQKFTSHSDLQILLSKYYLIPILNIYHKHNYKLLQLKKPNLFFKELIDTTTTPSLLYNLLKDRNKYFKLNLLKIPESLIDVLEIDSITTHRKFLNYLEINYNQPILNHVRKLFFENELKPIILLFGLKDINFCYEKTLTLLKESDGLLVEHQLQDLVKHNINDFTQYYSKNRLYSLLLNLINNSDTHWFKDAHRMLKTVDDFNRENPEEAVTRLIDKPKKFREVHDYLSTLTRQLRQKNFKLVGQEKLLALEKVKDSLFSIRIPLENHDLIQIGDQLRICVGGGWYAKRIIDKDIFIMTVLKNNRLTYCIELSQKDLSILQAKGPHNNPIPKKDMEWINNSFKKIPKDTSS